MKPKPLNLRFDDITIPNNEIAEASFDMIVRALRRNEREVDTKEEAYDIVFSLLEEYKDTLLKEVKQRIKSACEFYQRYENDPDLLYDEQPELRREFDNQDFSKDFVSIVEGIPIRVSSFVSYNDMTKYNKWLFKLAFGFLTVILRR